MKICHLATGFPISYQGGITNYVRSIANSQMDDGHEVWVITGKDDKIQRFHKFEYSSDIIQPFTYKELEDAKSLEKISKFFEKQNFDIIHIHMAYDIDWNLYKVIKKYNYIVSLHDYFFICPRIQMLDYKKRLCTYYDEKKCSHCISLWNTLKLFNGIEYRIRTKTYFENFHFFPLKQNITAKRYDCFKKLLEGADIVLPVSNRVKDIFVNSGINAKYQTLHIGNITADYFDSNFSINKSGKINVVMLGNLSYIKGVDLFIELSRRLDKTKYDIHFFGRANKYEKIIKEIGVIYHGPYKQDELNLLLKNMDLGLCLSVWEDNGPQVVMELLNNHVPVIGTRMGGIPDFVNKDNGFLFDPYNKLEIDELINTLNEITIDEINDMKMKIKPTTTTLEHMKDLNNAYKKVLNK